MTRASKKSRDLAKRLLRLCLDGGDLSEQRVAAVLQALQRDPPPSHLEVLKQLLKLARREAARRQALVEKAGALGEDALGRIQSALSEAYGRPIAVSTRDNPGLLAGLRVTVDCDVFEYSAAGALRELESSLSQ